MYKPVSEADLEFLFGAFRQKRQTSCDLLGSILRTEMYTALVERYITARRLDPDWIPAVLRELPRFGLNVPRAYAAAVELYFSLRRRLNERIRSGRCLICEARASADAPLAIYCPEHGDEFLSYVVADDSLFERFLGLLKDAGVAAGTAYRQLRIELQASAKQPELEFVTFHLLD